MRIIAPMLGRSPSVRRSPDTGRCYRLRDCLHDGRTVEVPAESIPEIVSAWLAELGATSPLVQELAFAVSSGYWSNAHALAECLSVEVAIAV